MAQHPPGNSSTSLSILALVVSLIALLLSWLAFNRSGTDVGPVVGEQMDEMQTTLSEQYALLEARTRIAWLRLQITSDTTSEEIASELDDIQHDLAATYEGAQDETQDTWISIQHLFDSFITSLRNGTADTVDDMRGGLDQLEKDLRTPKENT